MRKSLAELKFSNKLMFNDIPCYVYDRITNRMYKLILKAVDKKEMKAEREKQELERQHEITKARVLDIQIKVNKDISPMNRKDWKGLHNGKYRHITYGYIREELPDMTPIDIAGDVNGMYTLVDESGQDRIVWEKNGTGFTLQSRLLPDGKTKIWEIYQESQSGVCVARFSNPEYIHYPTPTRRHTTVTDYCTYFTDASKFRCQEAETTVTITQK